jgi:prepilin-type N-terminal cleavage/methylation domain-containing protein
MRTEKGFTLVEIMIVVAIITIAATLAVSNLLSWNRHNNFVGFQREVFSEIEEARMRAVSMRRQYVLVFDFGAETVLLFRGDAGSGSINYQPDRATITASAGANFVNVIYSLAGASTTVSTGQFYLVFNPAGDVYRWAGGSLTDPDSDKVFQMTGGSMTPLDTANLHLSTDAGETATIQLFCWTGKARLSVGTI